MFANNDIEYELNELRAQAYAATRNVGIVCCLAKETPSIDALRARPDLPALKLTWLQRHDRESGDLYGILPLILGMPVATTDLINRSVDKRILSGRVGYVQSWVLSDAESSTVEDGYSILQKLPQEVFVNLLNKTDTN